MRTLLKKTYPVVFTVIICAVSAMVLTAAHERWKGAIAELAKLAKTTAVLQAFGVIASEDVAATEIRELFNRRITTTIKDGFTLYKLVTEGVLESIGFEVEGTGRCGLMRGIMVMEPDRRTIKAFKIYQQEETPGLGSKVSTPEFLDQFQGKSIVGPDDIPGMKIAYGEPDKHEVDAVTGASMTSKAVIKILNSSISQFIAGRKLEPLNLELPEAAYNQMPSLPPDSTAEMPFSSIRKPLLVPEGVMLLSRGKPVSASDEEPMLGQLAMVTDGDKSGQEGMGRRKTGLKFRMELGRDQKRMVLQLHYLYQPAVR